MCDLSKGTHPSHTVPHTESVLANISSLHKLKKYAMFKQDCRVSGGSGKGDEKALKEGLKYTVDWSGLEGCDGALWGVHNGIGA